MSNEDRNKLDDNGDLYYKYGHTLLLCVTVEGLKQMMDAPTGHIDVNYVSRPFEVYNPYDRMKELKPLTKIEIFFLSYYHMVKKQSFIEVEREEVILLGVCPGQD